MKASVIIRFAVLGIAWLFAVWLLVASTPKMNAYLVFVIVASAIIVFVPMYKKYIRGSNNNSK